MPAKSNSNIVGARRAHCESKLWCGRRDSPLLEGEFFRLMKEIAVLGSVGKRSLKTNPLQPSTESSRQSCLPVYASYSFWPSIDVKFPPWISSAYQTNHHDNSTP